MARLDREYAADEVIVREGDPMPLLWYVLEGEVEVLRDEGARVATVLRPGKGGWCGELWDPNQESSLYLPMTRTTTGRAPISPYISLYLPTSPCISLYLPTRTRTTGRGHTTG